MRPGLFLFIAPLLMPAAALAQPAGPEAPQEQTQPDPGPGATGPGVVALVPDPAAEGLQPATQPPPVGIRLGLPGSLAAAPQQPSPAATVVGSVGAAPAAPASPTGLQVSAGVGFASSYATTGQVGVSADLIGGGPGDKRAQVTGSDPYAVPTAPRSVDRDVGVGVSYTVPTGHGATVRISGSVGLASYAPDEPVRKPLGLTSIKIDF